MNDLIDSISPRGKVVRMRNISYEEDLVFYVNYEHAQQCEVIFYTNIVFLRAIFTVIAPPMVDLHETLHGC